ncbi:hypothetical protein MTO96_015674 [Rhipicephalus appendiculatus]
MRRSKSIVVVGTAGCMFEPADISGHYYSKLGNTHATTSEEKLLQRLRRRAPVERSSTRRCSGAPIGAAVTAKRCYEALLPREHFPAVNSDRSRSFSPLRRG